jgi:hypothetical protein
VGIHPQGEAAAREVNFPTILPYFLRLHPLPWLLLVVAAAAAAAVYCWDENICKNRRNDKIPKHTYEQRVNENNIHRVS